MKTICPKECKDRIAKGENLEIIDIRELYEYNQCNIGSRHIPMSEIIEKHKELDVKNQRDSRFDASSQPGLEAAARRSQRIR